MTADSKESDLLIGLRAIASEAPELLLRGADREDRELGSFLKQYVGMSTAAAPVSRSSLREDTIVQEITEVLSDCGDGPVTVLDACCGCATLAKRILDSKVGAKRIVFWAVDQDPRCIKIIESESELYDGFAAFHPVLRQVCDLEGLVAGVDIVVMSNSLHEIQPRHFAAVFRTFNGLIHSERGRICVVDMEWLPEDGPESIAITWKGSEVEEFLAAAGFAPIVTTHSKSVSVYRAFAKHLTGTFDESAMNDVIIRQLTHKLDQAVSARRKAEAQLGPNPEGIELVKEWVVATGTLARVAEELAAMKPPA